MQEETPLLFGKWKPDKAHDFSKGEDDLNQMYIFDFAHVGVQSSNIYSPIRKVSAQSMIPPSEYTPDGLFEPRILEMYHDAIDFIAEKIRLSSELDPVLRGVDVKDYSGFSRETGLSVTVDYDKIPGGTHDIAERNRIAKAVYESAEDALIRRFGAASQEIAPNYLLWIQSGQMKTVSFGNGTYFLAESPLDDLVNAGTIYFRVISDDDGLKENHASVVEYLIGHINHKFKDALMRGNRGAIHLGLSGDGSAWIIDLSKIEVPKQLRGRNPAGILPEFRHDPLFTVD